MPEPTKRKGARSVADIDPATLVAMNAGTLPSLTLAEQYGLDFALLLQSAVPDLPRDSAELVAASAKQGILQRMALCGELLLRHVGLDGLSPYETHPSDTVRGWACYAIAQAPKLRLRARLERMRPLANDPHWAVREWAWLPMRPHVAANVTQAVKLLVPWVHAPEMYIRRYAVELARPRGVWTAHVAQLRLNPDLGRPLLDPCIAEPERYLQDSVANWVNDAAKSQPDWARAIVADWLARSDSPATAYICRRALRTIGARPA